MKRIILPLLTLCLLLTGCDRALSPDTPVSYRFREEEPAFLMGYLAARLTVSGAEGTNPSPVVGMIAGEGYPLLETHLKPAFRAGMYKADPAVLLEYRLLPAGKDPAEAVGELAALGVDVLFSVAGEDDPAVVSAAAAAGCHVLVADGYPFGSGSGPETPLARCDYRYDDGLAAGDAGFSEGVIRFRERDRRYRKIVPRETRKEMHRLAGKLEKGILLVVKPVYE
jgi:hypothetical protein